MSETVETKTPYQEPPLSRACLLCTDTDDGLRKSLLLIAVPGLHIATITRGVPQSDLPEGLNAEEAEEVGECESLVVNVEEAAFLCERFQEWIAAHQAYTQAHPGLIGRKRYTAEVIPDKALVVEPDTQTKPLALFVDTFEPGSEGWYLAGGAEA